ncbi:MAG TPA: penicillin acylase family protein [Thermoleophilaceae bacterium]|nr:penicillin acylase family protein [Thermoleophilaceae bacterium]
MRGRQVIAVVTGLLALGAASADARPHDDSAQAKFKPRVFGGKAASDLGAVVRRTKYGVPHVTAKNIEGAAYGQAYAFAEDNLCTLADDIVTVSAQRSRWFGPEGSYTISGNQLKQKNLDSDFFYQRINATRKVEGLLAKKPPQGPLPELRQATRGFVRGYNAYLEDVGGAKGLNDPRCKGKAWVRPITELDLYRRYFQLGELVSGLIALDGIANAAPVGATASSSPARRQRMVAELGKRKTGLGVGSNAWGLGGDATDNGKGAVVGNPHFPWAGSERFYQSHVTVPGQLDVSGGTLYGVPAVLIGHTKGLAWSHTVATAWRLTPFELKLVPGDPYSYFLDGRPRKMKSTKLTVDVGGGRQRSRTVYETVHGPMFTSLLGLPLFPWTAATGYAMGDVNADNFRYLNHFLETNKAQTVRQYDAIQRRYQGIPWVNSLAADSKGDAYFSMNGAIPNMPDDKAQRCQTVLGLVTFSQLGLPTVDGSRSACEWGQAPGSADKGLLPNAKTPSLLRRDYVANGNDSHWLINDRAPLEGFDRIVGIERAEVTPRTRLGLTMIRDRLNGRDGLPGKRFTQQNLKWIAVGNRQYLGELWRGRLVGICRANPTINGVDVRPACDVLAAWSGRDDLDAPGALLFRRFAARTFPATASLPSGTQGSQPIGLRNFTTPFDPSRPVDTPAGLADSATVRGNLASAVEDLRKAGLPLNTTLRRVQIDKPSGIAVSGGPGDLGVFNVITSKWNGKGQDTIAHGTSFIHATQFVNGRCGVRSSTFLTYGQSENPDSPHRSDYTRAFRDKKWNDMAFCADEVLAAPQTVSYVGNSCVPRGGLTSASVKGTRRGVRVAFRRARKARVSVRVYRVTRKGLRRVASFTRAKSFTIRRGRLKPGTYLARLRIRTASGRVHQRQQAFRVRGARVKRLASFSRDQQCRFIQRLAVSGPVLSRKRIRLRYRTDRTARVSFRVARGKRVVRKLRPGSKRGERDHAVTLRRLKRGTYKVRMSVRGPGGVKSSAVIAFRAR